MNICLNCKKEFEAERSTAKYCSDTCRVQYSRGISSVSSPAEKPAEAKAEATSEKGYNGYTVVGMAPLVNGNHRYKNLKGEWVGVDKDRRMYFCNNHQGHIQEYCEAMCDEGSCKHV